MKTQLFTVSFMISCFAGFAQKTHEHPDHLRGNNSNDQYLALPYYNEACELYEKGEVERAKASLYEAINHSFALTEAQLFLAKIFYDQNILDSAFLYFNSGIDFATHQRPHHYFYMAETGMKMEQYHTVKHNLKHFKKYYGSNSEGQYEENQPFTVDDYELLLESMDIIFNYEFWAPKAIIKDTLRDDLGSSFVSGKDLVDYESSKKLLARKAFEKSKKFKPFKNKDIQDLFISPSGNYAFYVKENDGHKDLYWCPVNGKKTGTEMRLPSDINLSGWEGQPFFDEENSLLYFSSDRNGNKDLFVAKINLESNTLDTLEALWKINTPKDEEHPFWYQNTFYFSSNGHPGFGGFDLLYTPNYSIVNGIIQPSNAYNMGKPYNTGQDDYQLMVTKEGVQILRRQDYLGKQTNLVLQPIKDKETIDFDIKMTSVVKTETP